MSVTPCVCVCALTLMCYIDEEGRSSVPLSVNMSQESVRTVVLPACIENPFLEENPYGPAGSARPLLLRTAVSQMSEYLNRFHEIDVCL